ncbi:MAG: L-threonylcarbamoyladenylate synthase, partial [Endomicrobiia bacterium]
MKIINLKNIRDKELIEKKINPAVKAIKDGGIVVFPTETVYGLGADCFNKKAVKKIFETKNRPYSDPLIVHISKKHQLFDIAEEIDEKVELLIKTFWPGPLSIVLKKKKIVPDIVTANKDTVCVRMPKDFLANIFIDKCGGFLAAPSANLFTRVSATHIKHILKDFSESNNIEYIIYDGNSRYGLESTIVDCTRYPFKILRYGSITPSEIRKKTNLLITENTVLDKGTIKVPGMFKKHYSPTKKSFLIKNLVRYLKCQNEDKLKKIAIICCSETKKKLRKMFNRKINILCYGKTLSEIAKNLYNTLRQAENMDIEFIVI